ncbi:MAG: hypothetical protein ACO3ZW_01885 [Opitutales bacterium]|jgi:putative oxidoreductase
MKNKIDLGLQAFLGFALLVFGLNKFIEFMAPPALPQPAIDLFGALAASGYILKMVALTEIITGVLLLSRLYSALALILLAPLSVNIVLFHLILAPSLSAGAPAYLLAGINLYLLFQYLPKYKAILSAK